MATEIINYPSLPPENYHYEYVGIDNPFMLQALLIAYKKSLDKTMPTGSIIVNSQGEIIGTGANGSNYHESHICERVRLNIPTGQGYEMCEGCHPKNHSERQAILDALSKNSEVKLASLYLWGHWWCCDPCWTSIVNAGITRVFLLQNSEILFNKLHPDNIVGHQFEYFSSQLK